MVDDLFSIQYTNLYINQINSLSRSDDVVDIVWDRRVLAA